MSPEEFYRRHGRYPEARTSYPNAFTEFVATNPVTKFLVPGAERFLQRGQSPGILDWAQLALSGLGCSTSIGQKLGGAIRSRRAAPGTDVYHGSTRSFDAPTRTFETIGSGEGTSAVGAGFNVTSSPEIAELYGKTVARKQLSNRKLGGTEGSSIGSRYLNYQYRIPKENKFIDLDKPFKDQSALVISDLSAATGLSKKELLQKYRNHSTGDVWFYEGLHHARNPVTMKGHSGVKYTDKLFGFDKGMRTHPFPTSLYPEGQTNYLITNKNLLNTMNPIRKKRGIQTLFNLR